MPDNLVWLQHCDEDFLSLDMPGLVGTMVSHDVKYVCVQVGNWHADGTTPVSINQYYTDLQLEQTISAIHTYSSNTIKVLAWLLWSGSPDSGGTVDLSSSSTRTTAVSLAIGLCNELGFDGFNDDLSEGFAGSDANFVSFANELGRGLGSYGLISSYDHAALYATNWGIYGSITELDFVCPMLYDNEPYNQTEVQDMMAEVVAHSGCNFIAGCMAAAGTTGVTMGSYTSWIGLEEDSKFLGLGMWELPDMDTADWASVAAWNSLFGTATVNFVFACSPITTVLGTMVKSGGGTTVLSNNESMSLTPGTYTLTVAETVTA